MCTIGTPLAHECLNPVCIKFADYKSNVFFLNACVLYTISPDDYIYPCETPELFIQATSSKKNNFVQTISMVQTVCSNTDAKVLAKIIESYVLVVHVEFFSVSLAYKLPISCASY